MVKKDYDAVIVGSGPNGLAAAITMQRAGLSVLLMEGSATIGGGMRTEELTLPGFYHDVCSAVHPMAVGSPFFQSLPLKNFGLSFIQPAVPAAHPLENTNAAVLLQSINDTAATLEKDNIAYLKLLQPLTASWKKIAIDVLAPFHFPAHPFAMAAFGLKALQPASMLVKKFHTQQARALWAGMAAHAILNLSQPTTSAVALVLLTMGHVYGWPIPYGGSISIAKAMHDYYTSLGGKTVTGMYIQSLQQLPSAHVMLFDVTPKQLLQIAGQTFSSLYKKQLEKYKYGMGVFKIDWALDAPIPFTDAACCEAGTIHIGNTYEEIAAAEKATAQGKHPEKPFVLLSQPSVFDASRAPEGKHTAWAYCHVPNGSTKDMTNVIEQQVERFAPGFKECILARSTMNTQQMEAYNPNYIGGDINGGEMNLQQLFTRPALRSSPYRTSAKGIYICSSSTPPGGGVHGMCGYHAAKRALKDIFQIKL